MELRRTKNLFRSRPIGQDGQPHDRTLFRKIGRTLALITIALVGLIVVTLVGFWLHNYVTNTLPKSKVTVIVLKDLVHCSNPKWPILIKVVNHSARTILSTSVRLEARLPGRSTNYSRWQTLDSDYIIRPNEELSTCWSTPPISYAYENKPDIDKNALVWTLDDFDVRFE